MRRRRGADDLQQRRPDDDEEEEADHDGPDVGRAALLLLWSFVLYRRIWVKEKAEEKKEFFFLVRRG